FCCCRRMASELISKIRSARESSRPPPRRRKEKSSSRMAATMLERVCMGRMTCEWSMELPIIQASTMKRVTVHLSSLEWLPVQRNISATMAPGRLMSRVMRRMRVSKLSLILRFGDLAAGTKPIWRSGSEAIFLHAAIKRASAESESVGRMTYVARVPRQGLPNQERFHFLQAHVLNLARGSPITFQAKVVGVDFVAGGHQHSAFDRMVQLPHVSLPQ